MVKLVALLTIAVAASAAPADLEGQWTGKLESGDAVALRLNQMGQHVSGTALYKGTVWSQRFHADLDADQLSFQIHDPTGQVLTFRLKRSDAGLEGEITAGDHASKVSFPLKLRSATVANPSGHVIASFLLWKGAAPEYTDEARQTKLQGTVVVMIMVDEHGQASNPRVIRGLGMGLDERAVEAVGKWQFFPGKALDGTRVSSDCIVEVAFSL